MRGHAHTHTHTYVRRAEYESSGESSLVPRKKKKKKKRIYKKTHVFARRTKLENVRHGKGGLNRNFPLLFWAPYCPSPLPNSVRTTWDFPGHGPATLNSSLDVIIHIHIYLYFLSTWSMYVHIYLFSTIILSFLVSQHSPIVFLSFSLFFSLARM